MQLTEASAAFLTRVSGKVVYGSIVLEAVLGAFGEPLPGSPMIVISTTVALLVVLIPGAYSEWIAEHMQLGGLPSWSERLKGLAFGVRQRSWILAPLLIPLLFFGLATLGVVSQTSAYRITRVSLLGVLFFFGFVGARLSGAGVAGSALSAFIVTLVGFAAAQAKILAKLVQTLGG